MNDSIGTASPFEMALQKHNVSICIGFAIIISVVQLESEPCTLGTITIKKNCGEGVKARGNLIIGNLHTS